MTLRLPKSRQGALAHVSERLLVDHIVEVTGAQASRLIRTGTSPMPPAGFAICSNSASPISPSRPIRCASPPRARCSALRGTSSCWHALPISRNNSVPQHRLPRLDRPVKILWAGRGHSKS